MNTRLCNRKQRGRMAIRPYGSCLRGISIITRVENDQKGNDREKLPKKRVIQQFFPPCKIYNPLNYNG